MRGAAYRVSVDSFDHAARMLSSVRVPSVLLDTCMADRQQP